MRLTQHLSRRGAADEVDGDSAVPPPAALPKPVPCGRFYEQYHGHPIRLLRRVHAAMREIHGEESCCIWLAGDSTVDNKYWLGPQHARAIERDVGDAYTAMATNGFERVLSPPRMVKDVTYWMNRLLAESGEAAATFTMNTAVEATTLASRSGGAEACCVVRCVPHMYAQDEMIRDSMQANDILVTSIGGNDIALSPSICTVFFLVWLMLTPMCLLWSCHPAVIYFVWLWKSCTTTYIQQLVGRTTPRKIAVCMVYYLDSNCSESWANVALSALCYCGPFAGCLKRRIDLMYIAAISKVRIAGAEVVPIALSEALDGSAASDYHQRVEPSIQGGRKMAELILCKLDLLGPSSTRYLEIDAVQ